MMSDDTGQIDFVIKRFQECQTSYEILDKRTQEVKVSLDQLKDLVDNSFESHCKILDRVEEESKKNEISRLNTSETQYNQALSLKKNEEKNEQFEGRFEQIESSISKVSNQIQDFAGPVSMAATKDELLTFSQALLDLEKFCRSQLNEVPNLISPLLDLGKSHTERLDQQNQSLETLLQINKSQSDEIENIKIQSQCFSNENKTIRLQLSSIDTDLKAYVDVKIQNIPVIPPLSMEDITKSMQNFLEPTLRESRNASLRATNCETKIILLERKIDQLQLMLNKLELEKKL
jgi:DNA repair exonuclease SbcCD ATPase subunit